MSTEQELQGVAQLAIAHAMQLGASHAAFNSLVLEDGKKVWTFRVRIGGKLYESSWYDSPRLAELLPALLDICFNGPPFTDRAKA